jgi:meiotic recombination protein SPO11
MALVFDDGTFSLEQGSKNKVYKSLKSITSMLLVFKIALRLLRSGKTATQRELYYMFPNHFKDQSTCNEAILQCASLLGVDRESLNLRASSRGLYSGLIRVWEPGIGVIDGSSCDPMSISSHWITNPNMQCDPSRAKFILVVEKEGKYLIKVSCVRMVSPSPI